MTSDTLEFQIPFDSLTWGTHHSILFNEQRLRDRGCITTNDGVGGFFRKNNGERYVSKKERVSHESGDSGKEGSFLSRGVRKRERARYVSYLE